MDPDPSSLSILNEILKPFDYGLIIPLIILLILLVCSALISGSEVAFFSLRSTDLEELKQKNKVAAENLTGLLDRPRSLLATILIANNFINVAVVILSSYITTALFNFDEYPTLGFAFKVVIITFLILLFGEVLPKVYANRMPLSFATRMSRPMMWMRTLCQPFSYFLVKSTLIIERRLKTNTENLSVDDLSQALELTDDDSMEDGQKILKGIVKFGSTNVKQIMRPRLDVICIDVEWDYEKVMEIILNSGYSRIPVYADNFDHVKGVFYIKDFISHIDKDKDFAWTQLLREPFYVPENKKIDDLLKEFQEKKVHLAVVVDEFGGTSGIITLEDIIEEIVGEISDEFDEDQLVYSKLDDHNFVFEGKIHLTDFYKVIGLEDSENFEQAMGEADTLAGFILEVSGKFPAKNEEIVFENYTFKVESIEERRINRIKVSIKEIDNVEEV